MSRKSTAAAKAAYEAGEEPKPESVKARPIPKVSGTPSSIDLGSAKLVFKGPPAAEDTGWDGKSAYSRPFLCQVKHKEKPYVALILSENVDVPSGFVESNDDYVDELYKNRDVSKYASHLHFTIISAISSGKLYIVLVEEKKAALFLILTDKFNLDQGEAMRLAEDFTRVAEAVQAGHPANAAERVPQYRDRPDKKERPSEFVQRHYADQLREGTLYQHILWHRDKGLMQALSNEFRGRRDELVALVPPKQREVDARLGAGSETLSTQERARRLTALRAKIT